MNNFWEKLLIPFTMLSPMEDVTDTVLRQMLLRLGRPDIFFTEFVNVDGLNSVAFERVGLRLKYSLLEKPIVAQLWGNNPENFFKAAKLVKDKNFDGIDINLGCSQKDVMSHNCGSALIGQEKLVSQIIQLVKKGAPKLPVSVKTRLGIKTISANWIEFLLKQNLNAIIIHGRLAKESYNIPANWEEIGKIVELRNRLNSRTFIIGNGDVKDYQDTIIKTKKYGVDGAAIGRGVLSDPWCFSKNTTDINISTRLQFLLEHIILFQKVWGETKNFNSFKKYIKMYIQNFSDAVNMRSKFMQAENYQDLIKSINLEIK